jgi:hypothetical protein
METKDIIFSPLSEAEFLTNNLPVAMYLKLNKNKANKQASLRNRKSFII